MEALVKAIAEEVLKQVNGLEEKKSVLIIGEKTCKKCQAVEQFLGQEFNFLYPDENPDAGESIRRIVPFLSISHMVDLAAGKADGPLMAMVLKALLSGQPVEVMEFEYKRYSDTAPEGLMRLFEKQERSLSSYGLSAIDRSRRDSVRIRKSLVTNSDVIAAKQQGANELLIPADSQLTALAVDSAREFEIIISRG